MNKKQAHEELFAIHERKRFTSEHDEVILSYKDYVILFSLAQDNIAEIKS